MPTPLGGAENPAEDGMKGRNMKYVVFGHNSGARPSDHIGPFDSEIAAEKYVRDQRIYYRCSVMPLTAPPDSPEKPIPTLSVADILENLRKDMEVRFASLLFMAENGKHPAALFAVMISMADAMAKMAKGWRDDKLRLRAIFRNDPDVDDNHYEWHDDIETGA